MLAIENYFIQFLIQVLRSCYICILSNCDKLCNQFRFTKFDTFRHYSNFCSHFVNGTWPRGASIVLLKENEHPIVHSDRGCHYRWSGWIQRMDEADLTRSMSKKGCSPDNSACEEFFGRMKNEMFYGEKWDKISVEEFISIINQYMQWYRDKRTKLSLGGLSPMEYRRSLGIA